MTDLPVEDDELLAPASYSDADHDDAEPADDLQGEWQFSNGFPDSKRSVRIWIDEESRHLTKVRISPRWRELLGSRTLDDAFAEAFFLANARIGDDTQIQREDTAPEVDPTLTWSDAERIQETLTQLLERSAELEKRDPAEIRWADLQGTQATGTAAGGAVTVTLSLTGLTERVRFDRKWAADARMAEITDAVMRAHQQAYRRFQPPTFIPGEHEELAQELATVQAALNTIMSKGIA